MEITPDLSLCLAYGGDAERLRGFLAALEATADPVSWEAIVVSRPSQPVPPALLATHPAVLFLEERGETPPAEALNQALRLASGRYLSLWSDAILLQPNALHRLLDLLDERPEIGLAAPRLMGPGGAPLANAGPLPSLFRAQRMPGRLPMGQSKAIPAAWLSDRALLFRREVLDDVGLLDSGFLGGLADADFCRRAAVEGWRLALLPAAEAIDSAPVPQPSCPTGDLIRFLLRKWLASR